MNDLKPYSDRFSALIGEYKSIQASWKTFSGKFIDLASDLVNFDEQVETISNSCVPGSILYDLFPGSIQISLLSVSN